MFVGSINRVIEMHTERSPMRWPVLALIFITALAMVLLGAEINGEMEAQTNRDTTVGPERPIGRRGAYYADHKPG